MAERSKSLLQLLLLQLLLPLLLQLGGAVGGHVHEVVIDDDGTPPDFDAIARTVCTRKAAEEPGLDVKHCHEEMRVQVRDQWEADEGGEDDGDDADDADDDSGGNDDDGSAGGGDGGGDGFIDEQGAVVSPPALRSSVGSATSAASPAKDLEPGALGARLVGHAASERPRAGTSSACPDGYPFPYSAEGLESGFCCATQYDCYGNALLPSSICCQAHRYAKCAQPPCAGAVTRPAASRTAGAAATATTAAAGTNGGGRTLLSIDTSAVPSASEAARTSQQMLDDMLRVEVERKQRSSVPDNVREAQEYERQLARERVAQQARAQQAERKEKEEAEQAQRAKAAEDAAKAEASAQEQERAEQLRNAAEIAEKKQEVERAKAAAALAEKEKRKRKMMEQMLALKNGGVPVAKKQAVAAAAVAPAAPAAQATPLARLQNPSSDSPCSASAPTRCPGAHPRAYSGDNVVGGFCCANAVDCYGKPILLDSVCCANHQFVKCPESPCSDFEPVLEMHARADQGAVDATVGATVKEEQAAAAKVKAREGRGGGQQEQAIAEEQVRAVKAKAKVAAKAEQEAAAAAAKAKAEQEARAEEAEAKAGAAAAAAVVQVGQQVDRQADDARAEEAKSRPRPALLEQGGGMDSSAAVGAEHPRTQNESRLPAAIPTAAALVHLREERRKWESVRELKKQAQHGAHRVNDSEEAAMPPAQRCLGNNLSAKKLQNALREAQLQAEDNIASLHAQLDGAQHALAQKAAEATAASTKLEQLRAAQYLLRAALEEARRSVRQDNATAVVQVGLCTGKHGSLTSIGVDAALDQEAVSMQAAAAGCVPKLAQDLRDALQVERGKNNATQARLRQCEQQISDLVTKLRSAGVAQAAAEDTARDVAAARLSAEARAEAESARCGALEQALAAAIEVQEGLRQEAKAGKFQTYKEMRLEIEAETWASIEKQMQRDALPCAQLAARHIEADPPMEENRAIAAHLRDELTALGFKAKEAHAAVQGVLSSSDARPGDIESLLRSAVDGLLATKKRVVVLGAHRRPKLLGPTRRST